MKKKTCQTYLKIGSVFFLFNGGLDAHERIDVNDPSIYFERIVASGIETTTNGQKSALLSGLSLQVARSIFNRSALWTNKTRLQVCFWNGTEVERKAVANSALRWNGASKLSLSFFSEKGITINCEEKKQSDIRVSLKNDANLKYESGQKSSGNWSLIGKQSEFVPIGKSSEEKYQVTMNLPSVSTDLSIGNMGEFNFNVGHEFGHALGLLHEFQSNTCDGWIYTDQLAADQGWSGADAAQNLEPLPNLTGKLRIDFGLNGDYDILSIMQYNFVSKYYILKPGKVNPCMRTTDVVTPSKVDLATLGKMYGKPLAGAPFGIAESAIATDKKDRLFLRKAYNFFKGDNQYDAPLVGAAITEINRLDKFKLGIIEK